MVLDIRGGPCIICSGVNLLVISFTVSLTPRENKQYIKLRRRFRYRISSKFRRNERKLDAVLTQLSGGSGGGGVQIATLFSRSEISPMAAAFL
jgi:hypothetical protein